MLLTLSLLSTLTVFISPSFAIRHPHEHLFKRASGVTTNPSLANGQTFDYIVVGGGLSGITVAARLAENASATILLIEAGNDDRNDPRVYDIYNYGQAFGTNLVWQWGTDRSKGMQG
jgi:hypothetical protein